MGDKNFMGGLLGGMAKGLQQQQEMTQKREYQKSVIDINKLHGKLFEAQARLAEIKGQGMPKDLMEALNRTEGMGATGPIAAPGAGQGGSTAAPGVVAPGMAAAQPQGPMWGPGSLPRQMAGGQVQIPGAPANNISVRQNNPFNLKDVGQAGSQGAGTRGFAIFNSPEEGVQAGIRQIQLDQSRGLPFAQFAEKYAPAYENPGWAQDVAKLAGITDPNTPINQIPTMQLAQAVATRESQTVIAGDGGGGRPATPQPQQGQQMQPPGQQTITPNFPKPTGIAGLPLGTRIGMDVYFKQTYDLDTKFRENEGKFKISGNVYDGFNVINEKNGQIVHLPPTMQKQSRYDFTTPSGAGGFGYAPDVIRTPVGGGAGLPQSPQGMFPGGEAGGGVMTKPPEYTWQKIESPTGAVSKVAVPKAQPGANYQEQSPGAKIGDAGRFNMIMQAENRIKEVNTMVMGGGKINRSLILKASAPGGGIGEGSQLYSKMYQVVDSVLRLETGAQANESEIKVKMGEYWPAWKDTDDTIRQKLRDLNEYANGAVELSDPTGQIRKMRQPLGAAPPTLTPKKTRGMQIKPNYVFNPATGKLEAPQ